MSTSYPGAYDALTNPTASDPLTSPSHAAQHTNANDAIEAIQQRVGLSGTSFPGSPTSGQRFLRTDRNLEYYYDGTRWLTVNEYTIPFSILDALQARTSDGTELYAVCDQGANGVYLTRWESATLVITTNDASNYWTVQLVSTTGSGTDGNLGSSFNTSADTAGFYAKDTVTVGAVVNSSALRYQIKVTKTGAPGGIYMMAAAHYRLIG